MKLGHIELFVRDPTSSLIFYRDMLGCDVVEVQGGGRCVWLKLGELELLLRKGTHQDAAPAYHMSSVGFVLYTDDLTTRMAELRNRGVVFVGNDGSEREPTFVDPDGHWFQLVNPVDFSV